MARVELTAVAVEDLDRLVAVLNLPADTRQRVRRSLQPLERLPLLGPELDGRWAGLRCLLGPWRWMLIVYKHDPGDELVTVITIQDARSAGSPTNSKD